MKILKTTAIAAMLSCSMMTPASAAVTIIDAVIARGANPETKSLMQTQCAALAAVHGPNWTGTPDLELVAASSSPTSGPTEVGTHTYIGNNGSDRKGAGIYTAAHKEIDSDPYRNGGSANMFGDQVSVGGQYSSSTYGFTNSFKSTFTYSFMCNLKEKVTVPAVGVHEWTGPDNAGSEAKANCVGIDTGPHAYSDRGNNCTWRQTTPAGSIDEERGQEAGVAIAQEQIDTLRAHEDAGEGYFESATQYLGQVVICISPSRTGTKLPGAWSTQNGYNGGVMGISATAATPGCNTLWYNGGAMTGVSNINSGRHSIVTVPTI